MRREGGLFFFLLGINPVEQDGTIGDEEKFRMPSTHKILSSIPDVPELRDGIFLPLLP